MLFLCQNSSSLGTPDFCLTLKCYFLLCIKLHALSCAGVGLWKDAWCNLTYFSYFLFCFVLNSAYGSRHVCSFSDLKASCLEPVFVTSGSVTCRNIFKTVCWWPCSLKFKKQNNMYSGIVGDSTVEFRFKKQTFKSVPFF